MRTCPAVHCTGRANSDRAPRVYRVDLRGPAANKVTALPTEVRQDLLRELGKFADLADERGLEGFGPVVPLWFDYGRSRVLYTLDLRKRVLAFVDLISKE